MTGSPTLRRKRLARRLRELREEQGKTAEEVAEQAKKLSGKPRGWSLSKLIRLEKGEWKRLKFDDLELLLSLYKVGSEERAACPTLAQESNQRGWWASYGDALGTGQFIGLEAEARRIRTYQSMTIPGLLQTEEYARALISAGRPGNESNLNRRVEARMFRKNVFTRTEPPTLWAVIDEAALLRIPTELHSQLGYLLEAGQRSNIGIQVLPMSRSFHEAMTGQMVILEFPPPDPPVVYMEAMVEELYLEKPPQITYYQHLYDQVQSQALSLEESREYIGAMIERG